MRGIGSLLGEPVVGTKRSLATADEGWFLLVTVLLMALPVSLVGVLYYFGLSALPLEVLVFGLGFVGAILLGHVSRERKGNR